MSNQSTGVKMERFQDKRHAIEGSRQRVGELSRSFSAAAVEGRQSLDEVMTTVLSAMPIDQQEVRIFFAGDVTHGRPDVAIGTTYEWSSEKSD